MIVTGTAEVWTLSLPPYCCTGHPPACCSANWNKSSQETNTCSPCSNKRMQSFFVKSFTCNRRAVANLSSKYIYDRGQQEGTVIPNHHLLFIVK